MRLALLVLAGLICVSPAAAAAGPADFMRAVYAHYAPGRPVFDPLDAAAGAWFSPGLLALIRRDEAAAVNQPGRLDGDPICDCQEYGGFVLQSVVVTGQSSATARVAVRFENEGQEVALRLRLVMRPEGWRIDDVGDADMPSLRALLAGPP
jgi:hypothetical protein